MVSFELKPNNSLDAQSATYFYGSLVLTGMAIATLFAAQGFWPVLPFAGLELGALIYCVNRVMRRAADRDWIEIDNTTVTVRRERAGAAEVSRFNRAWTEVRLQADSARSTGRKLSIGASNRWCVVGEFLTDSERHGLKTRLTQILSVPADANNDT